MPHRLCSQDTLILINYKQVDFFFFVWKASWINTLQHFVVLDNTILDND